MSTRRPGTCAEPGPYAAHCTEDRLHDYSCYDAGEDVSWNEGQWYDFDLAPHDCGDPECPDRGHRGPPGRESEHDASERVQPVPMPTVSSDRDPVPMPTVTNDGPPPVPMPSLDA